MPTTYTAEDTQIDDLGTIVEITIPTDGDALSAESANLAFRALADQASAHMHLSYIEGQMRPVNNALINGSFHFWQRFGSADDADFEGSRVFGPDRWYAWGGDGTVLANVSGGSLFTGDEDHQSYEAGYLCAITRRPGDSMVSRFLIQEVDRGVVPSLLGKKLTVQFAAQFGDEFSGTLRVKIVCGTGELDENVADGYTGEVLVLEEEIDVSGLQSFTTAANVGSNINSYTTMAVLFEHIPDAAYDVADWFSVNSVMLFIGGHGDIVARHLQPNSFFGGGTYESELRNCQRYYEKSYPHDTAPGTAYAASVHATNVLNILVADDAPYLLGMHPVYKVQKQNIPSSAAISLFAADGTADKWNFPGGTEDARAGGGTTGFQVLNDSGGNVTPTAGLAYGHWVADWEI